MAHEWIYPEYLQTCRDYAGYLNQLSFLLITASTIICYKNVKNYALFVSAVAFFIGIINLFLGLNLYGELLDIILNFSSAEPDVTKIKPWILWQFWLDLLGLVIVVIAFFVSKNAGYCKNEQA